MGVSFVSQSGSSSKIFVCLKVADFHVFQRQLNAVIHKLCNKIHQASQIDPFEPLMALQSGFLHKTHHSPRSKQLFDVITSQRYLLGLPYSSAHFSQISVHNKGIACKSA